MVEIAGDESGSEGENLAGSTHRYFCYGSTDLDAAEAESAVRNIRRSIGSSESDIEAATELKSGPLIARHADRLAEEFEPGGTLDGRVNAYTVDKRFFLEGKLVSLLIEEEASSRGIQLGALERQFAVDLHDLVRPAASEDGWTRLLTSFNSVVRFYHPSTGSVGDPAVFLSALESLRKELEDSEMPAVWDLLWKSRDQILRYPVELAAGAPVIRYLDPLVTVILAMSGTWTDRHPDQDLLLIADEQSALTAEVVPLIPRVAPVVRSRLIEVRPTRSETDHRIQIADIVAGAGRHAAIKIDEGAADRLALAMVRHFDPHGLWSDASPLEAAVRPLHS